MYATVTDSRGRLVPGLEQADFSIEDSGKAAPVSVFSNDSQPFTAVVMLDTSASMAASVELLKRAAGQFLSGLTPADRAQVGAFNDRIQLSGTFSNRADQLIAELDKLEIGNPTRLHDGIAASLDALRGIEGRRIVLVFSDGDDTASRIDFKTVLERARDEEVMVYAIGLESEYFNGVRVVRTRPSRDLKRIAEETGGGYFELLKTADLAPTFSRVIQELRSHYLLGFAPSAARRQDAQTGGASGQDGHDRARAQELHGSARFDRWRRSARAADFERLNAAAQRLAEHGVSAIRR